MNGASEGVLVVDASALVEVLRRSAQGDRVAAAMRHRSLVAPAHVDAEVLSALGRHVRGGWETPPAVDRALDRLRRLPIARLPLPHLLHRAWALRGSIALRDGLYVAAAEAAGASLLTLDQRLARSAPVPVEHPG